jgi:hypothetical protein
MYLKTWFCCYPCKGDANTISTGYTSWCSRWFLHTFCSLVMKHMLKRQSFVLEFVLIYIWHPDLRFISVPNIVYRCLWLPLSVFYFPCKQGVQDRNQEAKMCQWVFRRHWLSPVTAGWHPSQLTLTPSATVTKGRSGSTRISYVAYGIIVAHC